MRGSKNHTSKRAKPPAGIGPDMGLTVLVNLSSADYFYPLKNFLGATTLVFDPQDFADSGTGSVREVPVEPFQEVRITLNVNTKIAVEEVQRYSIEKRGCMFSTDQPEEYGGEYNYADCMVKCKLKSVIALCKCKPFNLPNDFKDLTNMNDFPYCSLAEIPCINKYRIKWLTYRPREIIRGLEREIEDSLNCHQCYPLCSSSTYFADSTATQLNFHYVNRGSVMWVEDQIIEFLPLHFLFSAQICLSRKICRWSKFTSPRRIQCFTRRQCFMLGTTLSVNTVESSRFVLDAQSSRSSRSSTSSPFASIKIFSTAQTSRTSSRKSQTFSTLAESCIGQSSSFCINCAYLGLWLIYFTFTFRIWARFLLILLIVRKLIRVIKIILWNFDKSKHKGEASFQALKITKFSLNLSVLRFLLKLSRLTYYFVLRLDSRKNVWVYPNKGIVRCFFLRFCFVLPIF